MHGGSLNGLSSIGVSVNNPGGRVKAKFELVDLDKKSVNDVFGAYSGWTFGGSFVAFFGASGVNGKLEKSGIKLNYSTFNINGLKFGVDIRFDRTMINKATKLSKNDYDNPVIIFDDSSSKRPTKNCNIDADSDSSCYLDIDLNNIGDYKFVKISNLQ